jgi:thiopeptide-type bacteriocin biosynthesis protein
VDNLRWRDFTVSGQNDVVLDRGARLIVFDTSQLEGTTPTTGLNYKRSAIRNLPVVSYLRTLLKDRWLTLEDIRSSLAHRYNIAPPRANALLDQLVQVGFILSELRTSPVYDAGEWLTLIGSAADPSTSLLLQRASSALETLDCRPLHTRKTVQYSNIDRSLARRELQVDPKIQIDARRDYSGQLPPELLRDIFNYGKLQLRLSPKLALTRLHEYFVRRYEGRDALVPVMEFVGTESFEGELDSIIVEDEDWRNRRTSTLFQAMERATRANAIEVALTEAELERLAYPATDSEGFVDALELLVEVHAKSAEAVADGDYVLAPSHHIGLGTYGPSIGRFGHLLGPEVGARIRDTLAAADQTDGPLEVELSYWPASDRSRNVLTRPWIRRYELGLGVANFTSDVRKVDIADILIGLDRSGLYLYSATLNRRIEIRQSHVYTIKTTAALARLLASIRSDGKRSFRPLDSGFFAMASFLPRFRYGRFLLTRARWRIEAPAQLSEDDLAREIERLASTSGMPSRVTISDADRKLLVDVTTPLGRDLLYTVAKSATEALVLEEYLPDEFGKWIKGPNGLHTIEILATEMLAKPKEHRRAKIIADNSKRFVPPGDWLYYRLYCDETEADYILTTSVAEVVNELKQDRLIGNWFFLRYRDPDFHLRFRAQVVPGEFSEKVLQKLQERFSIMVKTRTFDRISLDTYMRELERYGGEHLIGSFEAIFSADSARTVDALTGLRASPAERRQAALMTADPLIRGAFRTSLELKAWLSSKNRPRISQSAEMRSDVRVIQQALMESRASTSEDLMLETWNNIRAGESLKEPAALWEAIESVLHMHWNRFGIHSRAERDIRLTLSSIYRGILERGAM